MGIAVVVRVSLKVLESNFIFNPHQVASLIGGLMGLALAIWGIFKIRSWMKRRA